MTGSLSIYLDLIRFAAALVVVLSHVWSVVFPAHPLPWPGHQAVVVFFVLSGYVISYAVTLREQSAKDYAIHRAARVLSVAWPALALSAWGAAILAVSGRAFDPEFARAAPSLADGVGWTLANLAFLGQLWFVNVSPPLNAPYWSLNYEVWYYVVFGILCFGRGSARIWLTLAVAALVGPRIVVLMPVWFVGVWLQRRDVRLRGRWATAGFVGSIMMYLPFFWLDVPVRLRVLFEHLWPGSYDFLGASNTFAGDYLLAGIVALNFASAGGVPALGRVLARLERPIRGMARYTFSIYLFHAPVFALIWGLEDLHSWLALPALALAIVVLGRLTEAKLPLYRSLLYRWFAPRRTVAGRVGAAE